MERDGGAQIPDGNFVLREGDRLNIAGRRSVLQEFFLQVGALQKSVRNVMILGGSRIAAYLARQLTDVGMSVTIIEIDRKRCEELCELLPAVEIVCGDGCKQEVLLQEGIRRTDAFVALTGFDEENIIVSMYALECGVGKVITKVSTTRFTSMLERSGLDTFVCPKVLAAQEMSRHIRAAENAEGSSMEALYRMADSQVEAVEFMVGESSRCVGQPLKDLKLKKGVLLGAVIRGRKYIVPDGSTSLSPGDRVLVVDAGIRLQQLDDILE